MNSAYLHHTKAGRLSLGVAAVLLLSVVSEAGAATAKKGPAGKLFAADVAGRTDINVGNRVSDLQKRSVHNADGTIIETRKLDESEDRKKSYSSMVYSNGTGMFVDADTRVEVKKFVQDSFTPNRSDMDLEPSVSQTQAFVTRGSVGLCTSKLASGSSMVYQTAQASVNVRGRRVVIEANDKYTKISMLEGESTVRPGSGSTLDLGGQVLRAGQQAIIMAAPPGVVPQMRIVAIPPQDMGSLDEKVSMACVAKKTVYFDSVEKKATDTPKDEETVAKDEEKKSDEKDAIVEKEVAEGLGASEPVTAFDEPVAAPTLREIVAIQVAPADLPVEFTVSDAKVRPTK